MGVDQLPNMPTRRSSLELPRAYDDDDANKRKQEYNSKVWKKLSRDTVLRHSTKVSQPGQDSSAFALTPVWKGENACGTSLSTNALVERQDQVPATISKRKQNLTSCQSKGRSSCHKLIRRKFFRSHERLQRSPSPSLPTVTEFELACFEQEDQKLLESFHTSRSCSDVQHTVLSSSLPSGPLSQCNDELPLPTSLRHKGSTGISNIMQPLPGNCSCNSTRSRTEAPMKMKERHISQKQLQTQLKSLEDRLCRTIPKNITFALPQPLLPRENSPKPQPTHSPKTRISREAPTANVTTMTAAISVSNAAGGSPNMKHDNTNSHPLQDILSMVEDMMTTIPPPPPPSNSSPNFSTPTQKLSYHPASSSTSPFWGQHQQLAMEEDDTDLMIVKKGGVDNSSSSMTTVNRSRPAMLAMQNQKKNAAAPISPNRTAPPKMYQHKRIAPSSDSSSLAMTAI